MLIVIIYIFICLYFLWETAGYLKLLINTKLLRRLIIIPVAIIYLACCVVPVLGTYLPDGDLKYFMMKYGNIWLSTAGGYGLILFLCRIVRLCSKHASIRKIPRTVCAGILLFAVVCSGALNIYGYNHAAKTTVLNYQVDLVQNDSQSEGSDASNSSDQNLQSGTASAENVRKLRILLATDLHMSVNSKPEFIQNMVDLINAQNPDVVVMTGDYFTSTYQGLKYPGKYSEILSHIKSKYGVFAVYGNHDLEEDLFCGFAISPVSMAFRSEEMENFLKSCGFQLLEDKYVVLPCGLQIAGRKDGSKAGDGTRDRMDVSELLSGCDPDMPLVVLEHEPKDYEELAVAGADLVLSGHTHNGQLFPGNYISQLLAGHVFGEKKIDGMTAIVSAGVGFFGPPIRIGTDSDIVVIDLTY